MHRARYLFVVAALSGGMFCARAWGDMFYLANGGQISGQLLNVDEKPRETYQVRTDDGSHVRLTAAQVRRFVPTSKARRDYEAFLPRMPQTAQGHWTMAQWCLSQGLDDERGHHLQEVLRLDDGHREARLALGYTSIDGEWVKTDEWNRRQGYVYYQRGWRTPQEVALAKQQQQLHELQASWKPKLKRLRSALGSRGKRNAEAALAEIKAIKDPLAGAALADMYEDEKNLLFRKMWVEVLGNNPSTAADDALVKAAIEDEDPGIREKARDQLADRGSGRAVGALLAELKSKDNIRVNRAGAALARIKDPETFLPLVDALVTEHQYIVTQGQPGNIGASFSPGGVGGSGLSAGGGPKLVKQNISNRNVLAALVALMQDQPDQHANFQYDQEKWKQWYAAKNTPEQVNLRRDP